MEASKRVLGVRVNNPFTNLPSFIITTIVLSFYGCQDDVFGLLQQLSHSSREYCLKHKVQIKSFVVKYALRRLDMFGDTPYGLFAKLN